MSEEKRSKETRLKNVNRIAEDMAIIAENEPICDTIDALSKVLLNMILDSCKPGCHYHLLDELYEHLKINIKSNIER